MNSFARRTVSGCLVFLAGAALGGCRSASKRTAPAPAPAATASAATEKVTATPDAGGATAAAAAAKADGADKAAADSAACDAFVNAVVAQKSYADSVRLLKRDDVADTLAGEAQAAYACAGLLAKSAVPCERLPAHDARDCSLAVSFFQAATGGDAARWTFPDFLAEVCKKVRKDPASCDKAREIIAKGQIDRCGELGADSVGDCRAQIKGDPSLCPPPASIGKGKHEDEKGADSICVSSSRRIGLMRSGGLAAVRDGGSDGDRLLAAVALDPSKGCGDVGQRLRQACVKALKQLPASAEK